MRSNEIEYMNKFEKWYLEKLKADHAFLYQSFDCVVQIYKIESQITEAAIEKKEFYFVRVKYKKISKSKSKYFTKYAKLALLSYFVLQTILLSIAFGLGVETIYDSGVWFSNLSILITLPLGIFGIALFPGFASGDEYWEIFLLIFTLPLGALQYYLLGRIFDWIKPFIFKFFKMSKDS